MVGWYNRPNRKATIKRYGQSRKCWPCTTVLYNARNNSFFVFASLQLACGMFKTHVGFYLRPSTISRWGTRLRKIDDFVARLKFFKNLSGKTRGLLGGCFTCFNRPKYQLKVGKKEFLWQTARSFQEFSTTKQK